MRNLRNGGEGGGYRTKWVSRLALQLFQESLGLSSSLLGFYNFLFQVQSGCLEVSLVHLLIFLTPPLFPILHSRYFRISHFLFPRFCFFSSLWQLFHFFLALCLITHHFFCTFASPLSRTPLL
jgi:hypothetical protein